MGMADLAETDAAAIRAVLADEDAAWATGDGEAYAAHAAAGILVTTIMGQVYEGRDVFATQHQRLFASIFRGSRLTQAVERLRAIGPDVVLVETLAELSGATALPPSATAINGVLRTRLLQVMVREAEGWRVAAYHNVACHPSAL